jgi:uncharacterized protein (DUF1330 family)
MNRYLAFGLAVIGSAALGAAVVEGLHAQAKLPAYVIGEVTIKDKDAYMKDFVPMAAKAIQGVGGTYVARSGQPVSLMGTPPSNRIVIIKFDDMEKAQAWWNSPLRKESQEIGDKYATFRLFIVEGAAQ